MDVSKGINVRIFAEKESLVVVASQARLAGGHAEFQQLMNDTLAFRSFFHVMIFEALLLPSFKVRSSGGLAFDASLVVGNDDALGRALVNQTSDKLLSSRT